MVTAERPAKNTSQLRLAWLNMHLGWLHWVHNDPTDTNLKARHGCAVCRDFRHTHWGSPANHKDNQCQ
jgi:hypothetical protein